MSDFEFYEIELNKYLGSINEIIESSYAPENKENTEKEINCIEELREAENCLRYMKMDMDLNPKLRTQFHLLFNQYNKKLNMTKKNILSINENIKHHTNTALLLGNKDEDSLRELDREYMRKEQVLLDQNNKLHNANIMTAQICDMANNIQDNLGQNNSKITNTHDKINLMNYNLADSKKTINRIERREKILSTCNIF